MATWPEAFILFSTSDWDPVEVDKLMESEDEHLIY